METASPQTSQAQSHQAATNTPTSLRNFKSWFDEFKAKVSKKSQQIQSTNSDQAVTPIEDSCKDDVGIAPTTTTSNPTVQTPAADVATSELSPIQIQAKSPSLRLRKSSRISLDDLPNHSFASGSDVRRFATTNARSTRIVAKLLTPIKWIISYLIPFNVTLPWKLICLVNSSFVIIVIGLVTGSSQASTALSFCNGFIGGLLVASICFIILGLSFAVYVMPRSRKTNQFNLLPKGLRSTTGIEINTSIKGIKADESIRSNDDINLSNICNSMFIPRGNRDSGEFSLFEILGQDQATDFSEASQRSLSDRLNDENFKGWMIEFIGDYEQRNTTDIKLKSIFVRIENRILYLCKPKNSHDVDTTTAPAITHQRVYDLNNVQKFSANLLIPKSVRNKQKYVWSKKYPIKIEFQETPPSETVPVKASSESSLKTVQLTLFAKSCREKEEWFRRFKRIVEDYRFAQGPTTVTKHTTSTKCDETASNISYSESLLDSFRRFRRRSPSPKRDGVQTSQSSHILNDPRTIVDGLIDRGVESESSSESSSAASLVRTKSCELIDPSRSHSSASTHEQNKPSNDQSEDACKETRADDSTLTKETAEMFSQAIEYSNFIESQPTLDYKDYIERVIESGRNATSTSDWFNALTGRIFFDVFSHDYWSVWFKRKIQRKLYRIRLPYFMETLTLSAIDLGKNAPQFLNVVSHRLDSDGLSIDFDMAYSGGLTMTFETKLNLLKIKPESSASRSENQTNLTSSTAGPSSFSNAQIDDGRSNAASSQDKQSQQSNQPNSREHLSSNDSSLAESNIRKELCSSHNTLKPQVSSSSASARTSGGSSTSDSETSDSGSSSDSSFEEADANEISDWEDYGAEKTRQNIVKFVDKIASSRYFQHATENRYIKKKLQDISNCPLILIVQIQSLNGVLTLNVPPPQTDRLWYGFKANPNLILKAIPKMGDREVSLSHVTDWIERKLAEEFRKILVMPNMEDIVLPVLKSDHLQYVTATR